MTGAERSALRLALSMLRSSREWRWHEIANVLEAGGAEEHVPGMRRWSTEGWSLLVDRQLTARVSLYIRAVLRAERDPWEDSEEHGGRGASWEVTGRWYCYRTTPESWPVVCSECGEPVPTWDAGDTIDRPCPVTKRAAVARRPRPLWLDAREHRS